jgi:hypothetical protein
MFVGLGLLWLNTGVRLAQRRAGRHRKRVHAAQSLAQERERGCAAIHVDEKCAHIPGGSRNSHRERTATRPTRIGRSLDASDQQVHAHDACDPPLADPAVPPRIMCGGTPP